MGGGEASPLEGLRAALAAAGSLAAAIRLGRAAAPGWQVVDVVTQDELTNDVVMQATPDGPVIVLDCT
jgi:hypothetical protein